MSTDSRQVFKWVAACTLLILMVLPGCTPQLDREQTLPSALPSATASSHSGSVLNAPQPLDAPPATSLLGSDSLPTPLPPVSQAGTASAIPSPTLTHTPVPSSTPTPTPTLRQLTRGGCCTRPFWSVDSRLVLFIDKPSPNLPVGIWGVQVSQPKSTPELVTERIAFYSPDLTLRTELIDNNTVIERLEEPLAGGEPSSTADSEVEDQWQVDSGGRPVSISPGQKRIAWQISDEDLPFERRITQLWVADLDGRNAQMVASLPRGGLSGWISDDQLLLSGRDSLQSQEQVIFTLSLTDGTRLELSRGKRLRGDVLSPDGAWLAYFVALDDEDPNKNGIWLVRTHGSSRHQLEPDLFGAYQWRDTQRLLMIPFRPEATSHEIWEFDVDTRQARRLTDPRLTPFKIANGDWTVSPDGRYVAFVESHDHNIWLLSLPERS